MSYRDLGRLSHGQKFRISELMRDFNPHKLWVSGSQFFWPAQNRWFTCTSVRSEDATALPNTYRRKKSSTFAFFALKIDKVEKCQIWRVFRVFEVRGAGQDRKGRQHLPVLGCTGAGFLSWGWFWVPWYRLRCFLVDILEQIPTFDCFSSPGCAESTFSVYL